MKKKKARKNDKAVVAPKVPADELEELKEKCFRHEIVKLLRIEDADSANTILNLDAMPTWAGKQFFKLLREFTDGPGFLDIPGIEFTTGENFGELLGMKTCWAQVAIQLCQWFDSTDDASRAKLTKAMGGPTAVAELKSELPCSRRIQAVKQKALLKVRKQNTNEQGHFFKGFGRGLLTIERMQKWCTSGDDKRHKKAYVQSYIIFQWQNIEEASKRGGWPEILEDFQQSLPPKTDISEDTFAKALQRAGIGSVGKVGRPKKSGQKS